VRVLELPAPIDADRVSAVLEDGVLTLTLPKAAEAKRRRIEVRRPEATKKEA
jgi:HSP20 family protein